MKSVLQERARENTFCMRKEIWEEEVQGEAHARGRFMFRLGRETDLPTSMMEKIGKAAQNCDGAPLVKVVGKDI